jgi:hypothetical protein
MTTLQHKVKIKRKVKQGFFSIAHVGHSRATWVTTNPSHRRPHPSASPLAQPERRPRKVAAGLSPTLASMVARRRASWRWRPMAVGSDDFLRYGDRRREVCGMGHWLPVSAPPPFVARCQWLPWRRWRPRRLRWRICAMAVVLGCFLQS